MSFRHKKAFCISRYAADDAQMRKWDKYLFLPRQWRQLMMHRYNNSTHYWFPNRRVVSPVWINILLSAAAFGVGRTRLYWRGDAETDQKRRALGSPPTPLPPMYVRTLRPPGENGGGGGWNSPNSISFKSDMFENVCFICEFYTLKRLPRSPIPLCCCIVVVGWRAHFPLGVVVNRGGSGGGLA